MKLATTLTPPPPSLFRGAVNKRCIYLTILCLASATVWNTHGVTAAPAKLDLQPPIFEATASVSASPSQPRGGSDTTTIDSYGNPIESLQPIQTPDGRKVVSAQGLQFEIPNYASGITELKKPADNLLPPFVDPIVVALPNEYTNAGPTASSAETTTTVDVESVPLVEVKTQPETGFFKQLPDYILELNDPEIGGPVAYEPTEDNRGLKVIAWDLLPPLEAVLDDKTISHSNKVSVTTGHNLNAQISDTTSHTTVRPQLGSRNSFETTTKPSYTQNRGTSYYSTSSTTTTTPRTTTTARTTTTTTARTTTTPRITTTPRTTTTTTRRTTTPRTTTTRTTTVEPDSSEFFKLEKGDSYTLPPWLQDIDDPELDVAVAYIIPEDINEYNHTLDRDILPPLEPYNDLKNIHVTPPPYFKDVITTPRTTTISTSQPHWIRAKPTSAKPTIATFNNQFTSLSPSITSNNYAQRTTASTTTTSTTTTTTTTTVKPKTTQNYYNRQFSSTTTQTDKIGSDTSSSSDEDLNKKQRNPFLPSVFNDGKYKPQDHNRRTTTTSTTTTTTPAPLIVEKNPFEPTIPPWLKDFDYPDVAAGVPFVYDPNEDENPVDKNILPPSKIADTSKPTFISNPSTFSSTTPFLNSQTPQGFTNKFTSSATSLASSSSIPSIVTIPLPSTQTNQADSTFTQLPLVFVPPPPTAAADIIISSADKAVDITNKKTSSTFNTNFAAPFEPAAATTTTTSMAPASGGDQKKLPLSADRESFPPFNNDINGSSSTLPSKTTFTKSEDGKVITNNIFLSGSIGSTSVKPFGFSQTVNSQEKDSTTTQSFTGSSFIKSSTASPVFKPFGTTSSAASGFVTSAAATTSSFGTTSSNDAGKYTGRFGGPPGVLAPQNNGFTTAGTKSYNSPPLTTFGVTASPGSATNNHKFTGSFGGPPGILKPYDNVKNR